MSNGQEIEEDDLKALEGKRLIALQLAAGHTDTVDEMLAGADKINAYLSTGHINNDTNSFSQ
jgi:hypothetical protein